MGQRRGALVEWQPRAATGKLNAREVVELEAAMKAVKRRLEAGADVVDPSSALHRFICALTNHAATLAVHELRTQLANEPQAAGPDVEQVVRQKLDHYAMDHEQLTRMTNEVVQALREAGVEA